MRSMQSRKPRWRWFCAERSCEANPPVMHLILTGLLYEGLTNEYVQIYASARGSHAIPPFHWRTHRRPEWDVAGVCPIGRVQLRHLFLLRQASAGHVQGPA